MEYVIITGASIDNLGAESMTCIAIEEAERLAPDCKIILASTDKRGMQKFINYDVHSYTFPLSLENYKRSVIGKIIKKRISTNYDAYYNKILPNTRYIIDISGYAFTTKFGMNTIYEYLNRIYVAKCYKIKVIIMSQSWTYYVFKFYRKNHYQFSYKIYIQISFSCYCTGKKRI